VKDFRGKKMMITQDHIKDSSITSMFFSQGLKLSDIKIVKHSFDVRDLFNGNADLMASYISNEPYLLRELGLEPIVFKPKDYGFDFYNDILITNKDYAKENSEEVQAFKEATIKGFEYAFSNIDEAVDLIHKKYNSLNKTKNALRFEAKELRRLVYDDAGEIGTIELNKLERMFDVYKLLAFTHKNIDLNEVVFKSNIDVTALSREERRYIQNKKSIKVCIDPNWPPLEFYNQKGEYDGIGADYYKLFSQNLDINFEVIETLSWQESKEYIKDGKCDVLSFVMPTENDKKHMNFTSSFLHLPLVLATKHNVSFIYDIQDIKGKKIGYPKGYSFIEILEQKYPFLEFVEVESIEDGLREVAENNLFAYVGSLIGVAYNLQNRFAGELKIAGKINDNWPLSNGVRKDDPMLLNILQKAINSVTQEQKKEILDKWFSVKYQNGVDYAFIYRLLGIFVIILTIIAYFYNQKRKLHERLELAYEKLEKLAITDKLTGLYNRHKTDEILAGQKEFSSRYGSKFGIILLDIDYFKKINDKYGHHVGDSVLKDFANILKENSRNTDFVGRWGGEEFLIVVPHADIDSLVKFANILKEKIENHSFAVVEKITASLGVALYEKNEAVDRVLVRADEALYLAKAQGRNRVSFKY
jgi:polar amino acid transport system substrate-binding protein